MAARRAPDAFIACSRPPRDGVVVPAPIVVFEVLSPRRENRRRDEQDKVDGYECVPSILRYVVVESERQGFTVLWREPGARAWRRGTPETGGAIGVPAFGIDLPRDAVDAGIAFD